MIRAASDVILVLAVSLAGLSAWAESPSEDDSLVERWGVFELELSGPDDGVPYVDVTLAARFEQADKSVTVPGFYDGGGSYKIRFSPTREGSWTYATQSNCKELHAQHGSLRCVSPTGSNHGPVRVADEHYLEYADGTPYHAVGTTAYQWTSVSQELQQQTLDTLAAAAFNKIRMCFFPKFYRFGNDTEPWAHPLESLEDRIDPTRPNYAYFQNFDRRVAQLGEMGIQADIILFHSYDRWGYQHMGRANDDRYLRYLIARLSAFRNVWWSMANEYDLMIHRQVKTREDFDRFLQICQREDPHQRLRGIHNWYNTEDHFYDHGKPAVTHASLQTSDFFNALEWRRRYRKPLLFDEMRYEGDVSSGWGNLTAEEMTSYFWMAGLSGGYGTHGETYDNAPGEPEVRWWGKGGRLIGKSPERIAFFRQILQQAPVREMEPAIVSTGKPDSLAENIHILAKPGEYYLAFVAAEGKRIELDLPAGRAYRVELIDTWNRTISSLPDARPKKFSYTTKARYQALRITRK